jgi:hypothetical protein
MVLALIKFIVLCITKATCQGKSGEHKITLCIIWFIWRKQNERKVAKKVGKVKETRKEGRRLERQKKLLYMDLRCKTSVHVTFTTRRETYPRDEDVRYLGLHLDTRLTWRKHFFAKRKQLGITFAKMYELVGRKPNK